MSAKMDRATKRVVVGPTSLGLGVFAGRSFRRNQTIGHIEGDFVDDPDYGSDYCIDLGPGYLLEPAAPFRYLNHSCEPNAQLWCVDGEVGEPPTACLTALRTIRPGEELTIDYGWSADVAIPCGCGTATCRGWVVSPEELPKLTRRRRSR